MKLITIICPVLTVAIDVVGEHCCNTYEVTISSWSEISHATELPIMGIINLNKKYIYIAIT